MYRVKISGTYYEMELEQGRSLKESGLQAASTGQEDAALRQTV